MSADYSYCAKVTLCSAQQNMSGSNLVSSLKVDSRDTSTLQEYTTLQHMETIGSTNVCYSSDVSVFEEFTDEEEAYAQCKSIQLTSQDMEASNLFQRRTIGKENRGKLGKLRACVSLDEYSPPPSASFTIHRTSWVAMEDIEIGATIKRKKRARKSLSREIAIEKTIVIQEEPLVYSLKEDFDPDDSIAEPDEPIQPSVDC